MNWYFKALKLYANFSGRTRRREYWYFSLFNFISIIVAIILDYILGLTINGTPYGAIYFLYTFSVLIPGLAVSVRRLHDVGKSGWMMLISLIPIIGAIWLIVLFTKDSQVEDNQYGINPKLNSSNYLSDEKNYSGTIVILTVVLLLYNKLFWIFLPENSINSLEWFGKINIFFTIIWAFIPLVFAFSVKEKSKQILLFILAGIFFIISIYEIVKIYNSNFN